MNFEIARRDEGLRLLLSRLDDLCDKASRGECAVTDFLTPREARYARARLSSRVSAGTAVLWGRGGAGATLLWDRGAGVTWV